MWFICSLSNKGHNLLLINFPPSKGQKNSFLAAPEGPKYATYGAFSEGQKMSFIQYQPSKGKYMQLSLIILQKVKISQIYMNIYNTWPKVVTKLHLVDTRIRHF